jgi:hypothetical protein
MLFDLQSPKRKRVVQVVFGGMALLFAVSFVFLGIGTGLSGSPLEAIGIGGTDSADEVLEDDISSQEDKLTANPNDTAALIEILNLRYQAANTKYEIDEETGQTVFTADAEEQLQLAADAWDRYSKVAGKNPDSSAALIAVQAYTALAQGLLGQAQGASGQAALDTADDSLTNWKLAGETQLVVAGADGSSPVQALQAAEYLYFAGEFEAADAAAQQALAQASPEQRSNLQKRLDASEKQGRALNEQIEAYRKQLAKASAGAPGSGGAGTDPGALGGDSPLGGGSLGGGSLSTP